MPITAKSSASAGQGRRSADRITLRGQGRGVRRAEQQAGGGQRGDGQLSVEVERTPAGAPHGQRAQDAQDRDEHGRADQERPQGGEAGAAAPSGRERLAGARLGRER